MLDKLFFGGSVFALLTWIYCHVKSKLNAKKTSSHLLEFAQVKEDPSTQDAIKRTRESFKAQEHSMKARVHKAHDPLCHDTWLCIKDPCFVSVPDTIVGSNVETMRYSKKRMNDRKRLEMENDVGPSERKINKRYVRNKELS